MLAGAGRQRVSPGAVSAVEGWLTERDRRVLAVLEEHFTFTTSQLATLVGFTSMVTAGHRLAALHSRRVLTRARPFRPGGGSMPWHWMLGPIGSKVIAAQRGVTPIRPARVGVRWERLFHGWRYEELSAQHACFCALISSAGDLTGAGGQLMRWHCSWRVSRTWRATTDGHGCGAGPMAASWPSCWNSTTHPASEWVSCANGSPTSPTFARPPPSPRDSRMGWCR